MKISTFEIDMGYIIKKKRMKIFGKSLIELILNNYYFKPRAGCNTLDIVTEKELGGYQNLTLAFNEEMLFSMLFIHYSLITKVLLNRLEVLPDDIRYKSHKDTTYTFEILNRGEYDN